MTPANPLAVAAIVAKILDDLGIRYVIGGSVASSLIGEPRSTLDLDLMIEADAGSVRSLVARMSGEFYIDEDDAVLAAVDRTSFNAIHLGSSLKVDFFVAEAEAFASRQLERRRRVRIEPDGVDLFFYAPEDVIVRKLMWFRAGGEVSERQWRDVLGVLKACADLDVNLLRESANEAGVEELLDRAMRTAR